MDAIKIIALPLGPFQVFTYRKDGSLDQLIHSIGTQLLDLPGNTGIWPGHDYNIDASMPQGQAPTTLGKEKKGNPYSTDFILDP